MSRGHFQDRRETINTDDFAGAKSVTQQAVYLPGKCTLLHLCYVTSHVVLFGLEAVYY